MSTDVAITIVGGDHGLAGWTRRRVDELEQRWSRFREDSEISRLNRANGVPLQVSADTVGAVRLACAAWSFTGGRFDPTVHDSLLRLGYDDSIEEVRRRPFSATATETVAMPAPGCTGIVFDETASIVQLPVGVRLDLGGIGKGLAADEVANGLIERGATGASVNIGGDVRVIGTPGSPTGSPTGNAATWRVEIEEPRTEQICAAVDLLDGGVATSTTLRRRWRSGPTSVHHLIDPFTGANTPRHRASVVGVTVVAATAGWADALSKVPFIESCDVGSFFDTTSALVMRDDGALESFGPLPFLLPFQLRVPA